MRRILGSLVVVGLVVSACHREPPKPCRVNQQCFMCPDDKALAQCMRDPAAARHCKWAPPESCKP